ncbi:hypothetical protein D3C85_1174850 [compost metagenome]
MAEDVTAMFADRQVADGEEAADLFAAVALDNEGGDITLSGRQAVPADLKFLFGFAVPTTIAAAMAESCAAVVKPSLRKMFRRCWRKVKYAIPSCPAMARPRRPCPMSWITCCSRSVSLFSSMVRIAASRGHHGVRERQCSVHRFTRQTAILSIPTWSAAYFRQRVTRILNLC